MPVKANWQNGEQYNATDQNDIAAAVNSAYVKPGSGVPITDLTASVQASLGKADSAVQSVSAASISDSTTTGRAVLTATDAAAARTTLGVAYGTTSTTVAVGNDSRFSPSSTSITDSTATGRSLLTAADASAARTTLGVAYGTSSTTVAVGDDARITGAQQASQKGQANGYASLDSGGKVPIAQLPSSLFEYKGVYNASTNTPTLVDGTGDAGDVYRVTVAGSQNLGSGSIAFAVGDYAIYNTAGVWEKSDTTDAVSTVAGRTGDISLTVADVGGNTSTALGVGSVELGHATDTTLSRSAAGVLAVEGVDLATVSTAQTLTNKRLNPRIGTVASSATPAIDVGLFDQFNITALAAAITSMTSGLTGTPVDGQKLLIRIKDNGTARAITWGASFVASGAAALPTTTVASKTHLVGFIYDAVAVKWVCVASDATGY
jgi:hypothetical protein